MTESKKKATKKDVVEQEEAQVQTAKNEQASNKAEEPVKEEVEVVEETEEANFTETNAVFESVEEVEEIAAEEIVAEEIAAEEIAAEEIAAEETAETEVKEETTEEAEPIVTAESTVAGKEAEDVAAKTSEMVSDTTPDKPDAESVDEVKTKTGNQHPASPEDFDWEAFESEELHNSPKHKQYEALYDETLSTVAVDELVIGTVIQMTSREVVINIGYKSEGVVSLNEFRYNPNLKPGDKVEVYVESQEDKKGQLLLSHKKARAINSWNRVNTALEKDEIITGYIKCRTKGGMIVDVFGIEAFLPGSQIDVKPIRDYDVFVGKTMEFKVVKINQEFKNVVVSHKALIEAELEQQKKEIIAKLEKGQVLEGTVKNITSYGVFIDLGGVDGLIHITDLSWGRVNHPEEIVQLDQKLNVVILDFDDDKKRIALGLKQLTSHPWDSVDPNLEYR